MSITGYQQGILLATGCQTGDRYCVRNIDRWYCDAVAELFGTKVYPQKVGAKTQWVVKSSRVKAPVLSDISDWKGFIRAWVEIHGVLDYIKIRGIKRPRLRIYGSEHILCEIMAHLPAKQKKVQRIQNQLKGGYVGNTCAVYYQSATEINSILGFINENPKNKVVWDSWDNKSSNVHCHL